MQTVIINYVCLCVLRGFGLALYIVLSVLAVTAAGGGGDDDDSGGGGQRHVNIHPALRCDTCHLNIF